MSLKEVYIVRASHFFPNSPVSNDEMESYLGLINVEEEAKHLAMLEENPFLAFEKDFLRWMVSDGAGAFLVTDKKNEEGVSLRIEWVESASYAHLVETCMYQGSDKLPDGTLQSY